MSKDDKGGADGKAAAASDSKSTAAAVVAVLKPVLPHTVIVHPLVLLSVVDHYTRVAKDTSRRVVGVLLGEQNKGQIDVTASYALPFEEDAKDPNIWYIDRQYHEDMFAMFKKVNARERVIGWYSTGPKLHSNDIDITSLFAAYCPHPILVIIDVNPKKTTIEIPTEAYMTIDIEPDLQHVVAVSAAAMAATATAATDATQQQQQLQSTTSQVRKQFVHLPSKIEALEAEEVGVEHLLRGIHDSSNNSSLSDQIRSQLDSLKGLSNRLSDMIKYVTAVADGRCPPNHSILYKLQDILNLLPDIRVNKLAVESLASSNNDNTMIIYLSSLIRSITALHDLIHNKLLNKQIEAEEAAKKVSEDRERDKRRDAEREKQKQRELKSLEEQSKLGDEDNKTSDNLVKDGKTSR